MSSAKLKLGIYYFLENLLSGFYKNNYVTNDNKLLNKSLRIFLVKKKNNETDFFLSKSMPNFNFAEALIQANEGEI